MGVYKLNPENFNELLNICYKAALNGAVLILPTETVYGLFAVFDMREARERIFEIKNRPRQKVLGLTLQDVKEVSRYALIEDWQRKVLNAFLPGPVTFVFKASKNLPDYLKAEQNTIGIRIPDNNFVLRLLSKLNKPLLSTSANISGKPSQHKFEDISREIINRVEAAVDAGTLEIGTPSTVFDLTRYPGFTIREGAVSSGKIIKAIKSKRVEQNDQT